MPCLDFSRPMWKVARHNSQVLYLTLEELSGNPYLYDIFNPATSQRHVSPVAFVFDIDGVLIRGPSALPAAKRALTILEGSNPLRTKIPYLLLTNGGGVSEEERCRKLTNLLGFEIKPSQYIQAHTILKSVVEKYADEPVLVLGGVNDTIRKVAEGYGFNQAYTTLDVLAWNPAVWPFHRLTESERASTKQVDFSKTPIKAVFVFHDPRNWALDIQVTCDVIMSGGIIGAPYVHGKGKVDQGPELIFCNPDLIWRSDFERPRLGQGAFREAFQAVFKSLNGREYPHIQYGKPTKATYDFAARVLQDRLAEIYGRPLSETEQPRIYMIGDNPESDIAGANAAGWDSVLVHTGVYDPSSGSPKHKPTHIANDVEEAVKWAIERAQRSTA
ncbi:HAD-superfamily hydrolase [Panus rudis PR-1116 ss-1]|nr:HAD-superfamily hydrolase [Panus rudis PR-1116 ss-1]